MQNKALQFAGWTFSHVAKPYFFHLAFMSNAHLYFCRIIAVLFWKPASSAARLYENAASNSGKTRKQKPKQQGFVAGYLCGFFDKNSIESV